jgi:hypothetical protein
MSKYFVMVLILFVLSFGCYEDGTKNSDGSANAASCSEAPVITSLQSSGGIISNGAILTTVYYFRVMLDKHVDHDMVSDGTSKGIFVTKVNADGSNTPVVSDATTGWDSDTTFTLWNSGSAVLPVGNYVITVVLGDGNVVVRSHVFKII